MVAPPPTRRSLSGSTDCQHSQSSGSPERTRRAIHRAISRWPTYLPAHPTLPTADRPAGWTTGDGGRSRPSVGCGSIHAAPLASGWLHWRRAAHSGRSMADPPHRRIAGSLHRRGTSWVAPDVGNHEALGVSRQSVLQRVKRGQLQAVHVHRGRQPGLRIEVPTTTPDLFAPLSSTTGAL